jgi:hypothetical protein
LIQRTGGISIRIFPEKPPKPFTLLMESHPSQNQVKKGKKNRVNKDQNSDGLEPIGRYLPNR